MALSYKKEFNHTAKIGTKEIKFKPWSTKDEKNYLIAVEAEDNINDDMLFELLIKPCMENDKLILTTNEKKMLLIEIRKKSLGSTFSMRYSCDYCNQVNDLEVDFNDVIEYKDDEFSDVTIRDMKFMFGPIVSENLKTKLDETSNNIDYAFVDFLLHIHAIEIDGTLEDTFTFDELNEFMNDIPTYIFDEAFENFQEMKSTLTMKLTANCIICNESNEINLDSIPGFLWK